MCRTPMPMPQASRVRGHTKWRGRSMACVAVAVRARPRPGGAGPRPRASALGACACQGAPRSLRCHRVAALRGAGTWASRCAAMAYTPLEHSLRTTVGPGRRAVHARVHPPAPRGSGGCSHGIHIPTRGGCAGRFATGRGAARACCAAPSRTAPGSGCPLRPRGGHGPQGAVGRLGAYRGRGLSAAERGRQEAAQARRGAQQGEGGQDQE